MSAPERLRIVKYPWHTGHDYELCKLGADFFFVGSTHRRWSVSQRPVPANARFVPHVEDAAADVAILHVDQWTGRELAKRHLFELFRDEFDGPCVVINHGSNVVDGCTSQEMLDLVGDLPVICNSPSARLAWGISNSVYIRHGLSVSEWPQTNFGHNNIIVIQPTVGLHDECRNGHAVNRFERERGVAVSWVGRDKSFKNFNAYVSFLSSSSVFFNPSYASANPRARTEAMMCGLAIVTTCANGEEEYIENGVNGFASNDIEELFDFLVYLSRNPKVARRVGEQGRRTACQLFNTETYRRQWNVVLNAVVSGRNVAGLQDELETIRDTAKRA